MIQNLARVSPYAYSPVKQEIMFYQLNVHINGGTLKPKRYENIQII